MTNYSDAQKQEIEDIVESLLCGVDWLRIAYKDKDYDAMIGYFSRIEEYFQSWFERLEMIDYQARHEEDTL